MLQSVNSISLTSSPAALARGMTASIALLLADAARPMRSGACCAAAGDRAAADKERTPIKVSKRFFENNSSMTCLCEAPYCNEIWKCA